MSESEAYAAIRKFVASAIFLLAYIYLVQNTQDRLTIAVMGLGFIICLIQGLKTVLIKKIPKEDLPKSVIFSKGKKVEN